MISIITQALGRAKYIPILESEFFKELYRRKVSAEYIDRIETKIIIRKDEPIILTLP